MVCELLDAAAAHVLPLSRPARARLEGLAVGLGAAHPRGAAAPRARRERSRVGPGGSGKTACCAALLDAYRRRATLPAGRATLVPARRRAGVRAALVPGAFAAPAAGEPARGPVSGPPTGSSM